jgi:Tfp pilus assembly protein FimV
VSAGRSFGAGASQAHLRAVPERRPLRNPRSRAGRRQLRRRRLAGLLRFAVFLLLIFIAVWAGVRVAHAGEDASVYTGHQYVVQAGDTLWDMAAREYGAGVDLRQAVWQIRQANSLKDVAVQPGQHVTLPYLCE